MPPFLVRVSPAALRTIDEAFQDLKRTISDKDQAGFAAMTLDKVVQAAHDIEEQLAARQLLRNMRRLVPLFDGLCHYHKSIEVACNGTPYMPWIWAPITVILVAEEEKERTISQYVDIVCWLKSDESEQAKAFDSLIRHDTSMVAYVHDQFLRKKTRVTQQALERIILEVIGAISDNPTHTKYVHVVFDVLEECEKEKEDKIIRHFGRMEAAAFRSASAVCKVLVSSHMPSSVAKTLSGKHILSLSNEKEAITTAIATYASKRLIEGKEKMELTDLEVEGVKNRLHEVMDAVDTLPREFTELYVEMLTQIITFFDQRSVSRLRSILGWIAFAKRPLRRAELRSALSFSEEKGDVNVQELAPNYIFDKCKPIIEEKADTSFAFIHVSVKEYVHSKRCMAFDDYTDCTSTAFFDQSRNLAQIINSFHSGHNLEPDDDDVDSRLVHLKGDRELWAAARSVTSRRTVKSVSSKEGVVKDCDFQVKILASLLLSYQHIIRGLLKKYTLPGVSPQEFERFKEDFSTAAFTCRVSQCPLASTGFKTETLRDNHEQAHVPRLPCDVSGCHYPMFTSILALKNHKTK
ncbi:NACHT domain protein [Colletotrichum musicola]|uniref:NACHT domain protein n=1 Tax=Colletotrichum musicola TaxID=2175873 RepID=A0A8H6N786_9PEZI|nr:NACHT domain protein [Colletotrichum musicola]